MIGETSTTVACPACGVPLMVPYTLDYRRGQDAIVTVHSEAIRLHVALAHGDAS